MGKVQKLESVNIQSDCTYGVIAKQRAKREQSHHMCLHAVEKYKKVNIQNDYETTSKQTKPNMFIFKKKNMFCWFCTSVYMINMGRQRPKIGGN